jgi:hypothetical protein
LLKLDLDGKTVAQARPSVEREDFAPFGGRHLAGVSVALDLGEGRNHYFAEVSLKKKLVEAGI